MSTLPRYAQALGIMLVDPDDAGGAAVGAQLRMPTAAMLIGRPGFLHGGAIAGLLEIAAHVGLRQALGGDAVRIKPVTVTVDFMRGGRPAETFATAVIERLGTRIANVAASAWQDDRARPIASARLTLLLDRTPTRTASPPPAPSSPDQ